METLHNVLPTAYGVAGRCVGLVQGACYALQTAKDSLFNRAKAAAQGRQQEDGAAIEEPERSPEKKQRLRSPEGTPSPEKAADDEPPAEEAAAADTAAEKEQGPAEAAPEHEQVAAAAGLPAQDDPPAEQQPQEEEKEEEEQQAELPEDPTPAEAAGRPVAEQPAEVTKLEDVTGVQQPEGTFSDAVKPAQSSAASSSSEGQASKATNGGSGGGKKKNNKKRNRGNK